MLLNFNDLLCDNNINFLLQVTTYIKVNKDKNAATTVKCIPAYEMEVMSQRDVFISVPVQSNILKPK